MCSDLPDVKKIMPEMTILEIVSSYPGTEAVFKKHDQHAGVCICCEALFDPLYEVADKFGVNLEALLEDLNNAAG